MVKLNQPMTGPDVPTYGTDWDRLRKMTDADIQRGIGNDPDAAPALGYEEIKATYEARLPRSRR